MSQLNLDDVIQAWTADRAEARDKAAETVSQEFNLWTKLLQLLVKGEPVPAALLAKRTGLPLEQVQAVFALFANQGGEFDEDGNLVGSALTLNPTPHHFVVGGRRLYAWCSLDTLFLPGLIGRPAEVSSVDPLTGEAIELSVTPEGVAGYSPPSTVLSITVPGLSCRTDGSVGPETGPQSEACSQMHFFASRESAESWLKDRHGIAILEVDEAWRLAKANWLGRRNKSQTAEPAESAQCAC